MISIRVVSHYQFSYQKGLNFGLFWQLDQNKIKKEKKKSASSVIRAKYLPLSMQMFRPIHYKIQILSKPS
jgi:hypothetical protein